MATDDEGDPLDRLRAARESYETADERVEEYGADALETVADALSEADQLLARYEDRATGTGDFEAFITFQGEFAELVEELPEDLPGRDAFEAANDRFDKRRLSESDFAAAREALAEPRALAARLNDREQAASEVSDARRAVSDRIDEIDAEIETLERVERFGDVDLSVPTESVQGPIEAYNEAARATFAAVLRSVPARETLSVIETTRQFPLVPFEQPPAELLSYTRETDAGEESVRTLLAYDDYSRSKLAHYVADPDLFRTRIAVHRTYLDRLSADPLCVEWPPPAPGTLRLRARELVSVTARLRDRLATSGEPPDETDNPVRLARQLRQVPAETAYERVREAARADAELTDEQRERLRRGEIEADLDRLRGTRERLRRALDTQVVE